MSPSRHVQAALGWFVIALLLTYGLINLIGFLSPFWATWRHPGDLFSSKELLYFWQPIVCWFALLFVVAVWKLAGALQSKFARIGVIALGVLLVAAQIVPVMVPLDAPDQRTAANIVYFAVMFIEWIALLIFPAVMWHVLRRSNGTTVLRDS